MLAKTSENMAALQSIFFFKKKTHCIALDGCVGHSLHVVCALEKTDRERRLKKKKKESFNISLSDCTLFFDLVDIIFLSLM